MNDGLADSNLATVTIHVSAEPSRRWPRTILATADVPSITPEELLANDTDANGDPLTVVILSQPWNGQ